MKTSEFLQIIKVFLASGLLKVGEAVDYVPDPVFRLLCSCSMFEQHLFQQAGRVSSDRYSEFYEIILNYIPQIPLEKFKISCNTLDNNSKDVILRNLDKGFEVFPECNLSDYTKFLL